MSICEGINRSWGQNASFQSSKKNQSFQRHVTTNKFIGTVPEALEYTEMLANHSLHV